MSTTMEGFHSALDYTSVRDFAYPELHPLHYGSAIPRDPRDEEDEEDEEEDENGWEVRQKFGELDEEDDSYYNADEIYCKAMALFDFVPENDNEIKLVEGEVVFVSYRHGQGWLVAENLQSGDTGLVPEEYVQLLPEESNQEDEQVEGMNNLSLGA